MAFDSHEWVHHHLPHKPAGPSNLPSPTSTGSDSQGDRGKGWTLSWKLGHTEWLPRCLKFPPGHVFSLCPPECPSSTTHLSTRSHITRWPFSPLLVASDLRLLPQARSWPLCHLPRTPSLSPPYSRILTECLLCTKYSSRHWGDSSEQNRQGPFLQGAFTLMKEARETDR